MSRDKLGVRVELARSIKFSMGLGGGGRGRCIWKEQTLALAGDSIVHLSGLLSLRSMGLPSAYISGISFNCYTLECKYGHIRVTPTVETSKS
jgi:hypothetical protein